MVKKIFILMAYSLIITLNQLSCADNKSLNFEIKNNVLIINQKISVSLKNDIKEIISTLGDNEAEDIPDHIFYHFKNYPIIILTDLNTGNVISIIFKFYNFDYPNIIKIQKIILPNIKIDNKSNFDNLKEALNNKKIKFDIEEYDDSCEVTIHEFDILGATYYKENLSYPQSIEILIK